MNNIPVIQRQDLYLTPPQ
jgi:hypothetical protein